MKTIAFQMEDEVLYEKFSKILKANKVTLKEFGSKMIEHAVQAAQSMKQSENQAQNEELENTLYSKEEFTEKILEPAVNEILASSAIPDGQKNEEKSEPLTEEEGIEEAQENASQEETEAFETEETSQPETEQEEDMENEENQTAESNRSWTREDVMDAIKNFIVANERIPVQKEFKLTNGLPSYKAARRALEQSPADYCRECYNALLEEGEITLESEERYEMGISM